MHEEAGFSRSATAKNYLMLGGRDALQASAKINIQRALISADPKTILD